jgi:hypothetical protein
MSKWQPIETAPKDGTIILVAWGGTRRVWPARFGDVGPEDAWVGWSNAFGEMHITDMTHWMPLPEPPNQ